MRIAINDYLWICLLVGCFLGCNSKKESNNTAGAIASSQQTDSQPLDKPDKNVRVFTGSVNSFHCCAVSSDGKLLAGGSGENKLPDSPGNGSGEIWLWDIQSRKVKAILRGHNEIVIAVAFTPDNRFLVSGDQDGTVRVWNIESSKEVISISEKNSNFHAFSVLPDEKGILVSFSEKITSPTELANNKKWLLHYDLTTGDLIKKQMTRDLPVKDIATARNGSILATANGWASIWKLSDLSLIKTFKEPGTISSVALSPDGNTLLTGNFHGVVTMRNLETDYFEHMPMHSKKSTGGVFARVTALAFSSDGTWVASGGWSKRVCVWHPYSDDLQFWELKNWVSGIAFNPINNHLFASTWSNEIVELIPDFSESETP